MSSSADPTLPPTDQQAFYLYALSRTEGESVDEAGIEDRPVYWVQHDSFAAAVSVVERADWQGDAGAEHLESLSWVAPRAYRHEQTVETIMDRAGPVFPARFGTLFSTRARLRASIEEHRAALRSYFDTVAGAEEWAVKGLLDREQVKAHLVDEPATTADSGTAYLQRRKDMQDASAVVEEWIDDAADALYGPLSARAIEARVLPVRGNAGREAEVAFNWAFLVSQSQAESFREAVTRQGREYEAQGLSLDLTGPWPPYNFRPSLGMGAPDDE